MIPRLNTFRISSSQRQIIRFFASIALAIGLLFLIQLELTPLAVLLALTSKWQVLLGGPRLWLHNLWDNAVDIIFLLSVIAFLAIYNIDPAMQIAVVGLYLAWQLFIKPLTGVVGHSLQAITALVVAITLIFILKSTLGLAGMMVLSWLVALAVADHFLISITDELSLRRLLMSVWSLIVVQTVWIFGRWLVFYPFWEGRILVPQATLVIVAMAYVFGVIYYDHYQKRLSRKRLYAYIMVLVAITMILIMGSEWVSQL